jgi:hypothetical protein
MQTVATPQSGLERNDRCDVVDNILDRLSRDPMAGSRLRCADFSVCYLCICICTFP